MESDSNNKKAIPESSTPKAKRQRGRPCVLDQEALALVKRYYPCNERTRRNVYQKFYQLRAMGVLGLAAADNAGEPSPFPWLFDFADPERRGGFKQSVLAELGRIKNDARLKDMAVRLCENPPRTVHEAVRQVREYRLIWAAEICEEVDDAGSDPGA